MGKYDHIIAKQADIQYKILMAQIARANEADERNRLKRIELAVIVMRLDASEKMRVETLIEEDLDLSES